MQPRRRTGDRRAQTLPGQSVRGPQLCLLGQVIKKLSCFKKKNGVLCLTSCSISGRVVQATVWVLKERGWSGAAAQSWGMPNACLRDGLAQVMLWL